MTEFVPTAKGNNIRFPSTANLYVDSLDRADGTSSANFIINKPNNILSGFFTRLALTEITLDWSIPNVISGVNNEFIIRIGSTNTSVLIDTGFYSVAECLVAITAALNTALGAGTFSLVANARGAALTKAAGSFAILVNTLSVQLGSQVSVPGGTYTFGSSFTFFAPVLLNDKYIDITSTQLTYCQDLKDASTAQTVRDVVFRWFFAWDEQTLYDTYNYPILQGYRAFLQRRSISFPKQIKWDNIQPIGQLGFQVYDSLGELLDVPAKDPQNLGLLSKGEMEFDMLLLVSEV